MSRDSKTYLEDMLLAAERISRYVAGMDEAAFLSDERTRDAVIRNLEVIGEAAKCVSGALRQECRQIEWRKLAGMRDVLIHQYFGINDALIWDIISTKISPLITALRPLLEDEARPS